MFDTVRVVEDGVSSEMSAEAFFALPLSVRLRHVIQRTATFHKDGQPVDQKAALAAIRKARVAA